MYEMRLSGSGGQGLILLGIIIAEAAIMDGKLAVQSQSYGPEARGGASKSEVIISEDKPIHYPKVTNPKLLLAMTQEALSKYSTDLDEDAIVIVDTTFVKEIPENMKHVIKLPITHETKEQLGKDLFANIVALGAIVELTKTVSIESATAAVLNKVPAGTEDINKKAMQLGMTLLKSVSI